MFRLTPEAQARAKEIEDWYEDRKRQFALLNDGSLVASAELYMRHAEPKHYAPGEPVYDATLWHVILPELMRRVKHGSNA